MRTHAALLLVGRFRCTSLNGPTSASTALTWIPDLSLTVWDQWSTLLIKLLQQIPASQSSGSNTLMLHVSEMHSQQYVLVLFMCPHTFGVNIVKLQ